MCILNLKKLIALFLVLSVVTFSFACGEIPTNIAEDDIAETEFNEQDFAAMADEEFEIDTDALIALEEEALAVQGKADGGAAMVAIPRSHLRHVKAGARTVQIARGIFAVARFALAIAAVSVAPVVIGGVLIAAAVGGAIIYANQVATRQELIDQVAAATVVERGAGKFKVLSSCQVKMSGAPNGDTLAYIPGIGFGKTLGDAKNMAKKAANAICPRTTQARHCKPKKCWKNNRPYLPCN